MYLVYLYNNLIVQVVLVPLLYSEGMKATAPAGKVCQFRAVKRPRDQPEQGRPTRRWKDARPPAPAGGEPGPAGAADSPESARRTRPSPARRRPAGCFPAQAASAHSVCVGGPTAPRD